MNAMNLPHRPTCTLEEHGATRNLLGVGRLSEQGRSLWLWTTSTSERPDSHAKALAMKAVVSILRVLKV